MPKITKDASFSTFTCVSVIQKQNLTNSITEYSMNTEWNANITKEITKLRQSEFWPNEKYKAKFKCIHFHVDNGCHRWEWRLFSGIMRSEIGFELKKVR